MQNQPPDKNNPANPLFKVCALSIDKRYNEIDNYDDIAVPVGLSFKKSSDMRGRARTVHGQEVSVSFSLALSRASFDINFQIEGNSTTAVVVDLKKVSFQSALSASGNFKDEISQRSEKKRTSASSISGSGRATSSNASAELSIGGKVSNDLSVSQLRSTNYSINFPVSNIKVTSAGNRINWEVHPKGAHIQGDLTVIPAHLDGDMFPNGEPNELNCACFVRRKPEFRNASLVVGGSVSTSLKDMIVGDIHFSDELGNEIDWKEVKDEGNVRVPLTRQILRSEDVKKSLLKSIIRKHLVSQGMLVDGACVEISKAYT